MLKFPHTAPGPCTELQLKIFAQMLVKYTPRLNTWDKNMRQILPKLNFSQFVNESLLLDSHFC